VPEAFEAGYLVVTMDRGIAFPEPEEEAPVFTIIP
jgi:hypothetical protein